MSAAGQKILGSLVTLGAIGGVASYVGSQLKHESDTMDRFFSTYNTPESEASRQKAFANAVEDPRTNLLNVLGWKR